MLSLMLGGRSEHPELWAFLESLRPGESLSGTIAAIERFGVLVALDDGPAHPAFAGIGFITAPELSWRRFNDASDVVHVEQRVSCVFLHLDTWNLEARLSLGATRPDPFQAFADHATLGHEPMGPVMKIVPIGAIVQVADGFEGLVRAQEFAGTGVEALGHAVKVGDELAVRVTDLEREWRRLTLGLW